MRVKFWGTRGSLATPAPTALRYGGNTACVEVRAADGTRLVLDCGTGAYGLGQAIVAADSGPSHGHLLLTHTHWDHIQGFPFFAPLRVSGVEWDIYAPGSHGQHLELLLAGQMDYEYFPIDLGQLAATLRFHDLVEGEFDAGPVRVTAWYLNHPALTLGYRIEVDGVVLVYATDHEPHAPLYAGPPTLGAGADAPAPTGNGPTAKDNALPLHPEDRRHVAMLAGADLLIHDAQYTTVEYARRVGWGHSAAEQAVDLARLAGARRLALFHHDPHRDDAALDALVAVCQRRAGNDLEVFAAAEGQSIELPALAETRMRPAIARSAFLATPEGAAPAEQTVRVVTTADALIGRLSAYLRPEGVRLLRARDGASAARLAQATTTDLMLLDSTMDTDHGLAVCRTLRKRDGLPPEVPLVMLTPEAPDEAVTTTSVAAGVTDFLPRPFTPAGVRALVRRWLLRQQTEGAGHEADAAHSDRHGDSPIVGSRKMGS